MYCAAWRKGVYLGFGGERMIPPQTRQKRSDSLCFRRETGGGG
jgi:hypothetical protein